MKPKIISLKVVRYTVEDTPLTSYFTDFIAPSLPIPSFLPPVVYRYCTVIT